MLFRKRERRAGAPHLQSVNAPLLQGRQQLFTIDFDMMVKGSICKRRRGLVRQFGVTVKGATRLVTSGDTVDLDTYEALLVAGAIQPAAAAVPDDDQGRNRAAGLALPEHTKE